MRVSKTWLILMGTLALLCVWYSVRRDMQMRTVVAEIEVNLLQSEKRTARLEDRVRDLAQELRLVDRELDLLAKAVMPAAGSLAPQ
jgi:hypothetical protein